MAESMILFSKMMESIRQLDERDQPVPFDIQFITYDKKRKTGGDIMEIKGAVMSGVHKPSAREKHLQRMQVVKGMVKDPHHYEHDTINVKVKGSDQTRKIHVRLITAFNDTRVIY